jgi:type II secretory pathway component PulF
MQLLVIGLFLLFGVNVFRHIGDRLLPGRHRATVLRGLALAAERDRPFDAAIQALAEAYPSYKWQKRLRRAARQIREGKEWSDAIRETGLMRRSSYALVRAGERVGNLAWTLRVAADQEESREAYRWAAVLQVVFPLLITFLAAMVGFICYALFVPLVELIDGLAVSA